MTRRKIYSILLVAAFCGMAFVGCKKDDPLAGKDYNTIITVKNSDAKTHYDNGAVVWDEGDQISVVRGNSSESNPVSPFDLEWPLGDNGVARFYGTIPEGASSDAAYFALYPAQSNVEVTSGKVTCEAIPHTQTLTTNTFGRGNNTSVGYNQSTTMQFRNVGGLAKIAVGGTVGVKSITITASGSTLSGRGTINVLDNDLPITWASSGTYDNVVATAASPISVAEPKFFFVVLPPCTLSSYTVTITDEYDCQHSLTFDTPVTIGRAKVAMLGGFEVHLEVPTVPENNQICYTATSKLDNISFFAGATQHLYDPETGRGCVTFSSTVTSIPDYAFEENLAICSITLPSTVITIGDSAFYECLYLSGATLPGVQTIGRCAFHSCPLLTSIDLPEVRTIGWWAFGICNLSDITLGPHISELGDVAFGGNHDISEVYCYSVEPPRCDYNPFDRTCQPLLHVPAGCREAYASWSGWVRAIIADLE